MSDYTADQVIAIGFFDTHARNESELAIQVLDYKFITKNKSSSLPLYGKLLMNIISWSLFFIGSYFKFIIYKFLWEKRKQKSSKTIDVLICVTAIMQHLYAFLLTTERTLRHTDSSFEIYKHSGACGPVHYFNQFAFYYSYIGGFGIALYRILLIRKGNWVKYKFGEKNMMTVILFGGIILGIGLLALPKIWFGSLEKLAWDECLLNVHVKHTLEELDDYEQSLGTNFQYSTLQSYRIGWAIIGFSFLVITIAEVTIYGAFFHAMYKHDNNERLARLLEPATIKKRNQNNALTFFGQLCAFTFEFVLAMFMLIFAGFSKQELRSWAVIFIVKDFSFTAMSAVEVLTSSILRPGILRWKKE